MKDIVLIGGGGHCKAVIDVIELTGEYKIVGIIESHTPYDDVMGYEVIGVDDDMPDIAQQHTHAIVTVGQIGASLVRTRLFDQAKASGFILPTIISTRAYVARSAQIGEGTVVMHDALVNANANVGKNCIINTKALVEHDVHIENNCHVSTGAIVNGGAHVGAGSFVGSGAVTRESLVIFERAFIKAGSVAK